MAVITALVDQCNNRGIPFENLKLVHTIEPTLDTIVVKFLVSR